MEYDRQIVLRFDFFTWAEIVYYLPQVLSQDKISHKIFRDDGTRSILGLFWKQTITQPSQGGETWRLHLIHAPYITKQFKNYSSEYLTRIGDVGSDIYGWVKSSSTS